MKKLRVWLPVYLSVFWFLALTGFLPGIQPALNAQKLDVAYVPTPDFVVKKMLDMAGVGPGDYVIDLGCGDGRIVIAAAKRGATGRGVDLDPQRIKEARLNAEKAGVAEKVDFVKENIFDTDFSRASVVAIYLFPDINIRLRPSLLEKLEPGSRIVSHDFGMDEWQPDQKFGRMDQHSVCLWIVPAKVAGAWKGLAAGQNLQISISQEFQKLKLTVLLEETALNVENSSLSGKEIRFTAINPPTRIRYVFNGQASHNEISGVVQVYEGEKLFVEKWVVSRESSFPAKLF